VPFDETYFEIVQRVMREAYEVEELRRAVGPWSFRVDSIRASSGGKDLSETMTLLLALIVFDGYELFPANHDLPGSAANRNL